MWVIPIESDQKESDQFTIKTYDESYYLTVCKPPKKDIFKAVVHEEEKGKANTFKCSYN